MTEVNSQEPQGTSRVENITIPQKETHYEVVGRIGEFEITQNPNAAESARELKERVLDDFARYSGKERDDLKRLFKLNPYSADPSDAWRESVIAKKRFGEYQPIAASVWDVNGCLTEARDGYSPTQTFDPILREAIMKKQDRLGSFVAGTALTTEQMIWHIAKDPELAERTILSCENGKAWAVAVKEGDTTTFVEYRQPLNPEQQKAINHLQEVSEALAKVMRKNDLIAFVNFQKYSKCTIEATKNGREWYSKTAKELVLPFLASQGAKWDGESNVFTLDGQDFCISPTPETWEIDPVEGADKIGKRFIREISYNTLVDILHERKSSAGFKMETGGDSVKFGGSDAGLTDPNLALGHLIPSSEKKPEKSLENVLEGINLGRKYWPTYIKDNEEVRLAGPGIAPANVMEVNAQTVPHLRIPTEVFKEALRKRLLGVYGFKEYKKYDMNKPPELYRFPSDMTEEQKQIFLKSKPDLEPSQQEEMMTRLKAELQV